MTDQMIRDLTALIIVLGGLFVAGLELREFSRCLKSYRWIYLIKALAGLLCAFLFTMALFRLFPGGSDIVSPALGRPVFIVTLLALALGAIHQRKITGGC
jgi:high-affinity Fe2+/Pb2+ permease